MGSFIWCKKEKKQQKWYSCLGMRARGGSALEEDFFTQDILVCPVLNPGNSVWESQPQAYRRPQANEEDGERKSAVNCLIFFFFWQMSRILLNDVLREGIHKQRKCLGQRSGFWGGQVHTHSTPLHQGANSTIAPPLPVHNKLQIGLHAVHTAVRPSLNPLMHDRKLSFPTSTLHSWGTLKSLSVWQNFYL